MLNLTVTPRYVLTEIRIRLIKALWRWAAHDGEQQMDHQFPSTRSYDILTVSFRPHYLPRELGQVTIVLVDIPGPDLTGAAERDAEGYNRTISRSVDQAVFVLGHLNSCGVTSLLPDVH